MFLNRVLPYWLVAVVIVDVQVMTHEPESVCVCQGRAAVRDIQKRDGYGIIKAQH
jgi:hypothetical protein